MKQRLLPTKTPTKKCCKPARRCNAWRTRNMASRVSVGVGALVCCTFGYPQDSTPPPGQLIPRSFATPVAPASSTAIPHSEPLALPGGNDARLEVGRVELWADGVPVPEGVSQLIHEIEGQPHTVNELYAAVARIEQIYIDGGYFLTRVVIPPQGAVNGGVLKIRVVPGFIEKINADTLPPPVRDRVQAVLAPLMGQRPLLRTDFERRL